MTRLRGEAGFSLTELLISLIMISVGVVGFATAVGLISKEVRIGGRDTEVALLVTDRMEALKAMGHDAIVPGTASQGPYQLSWNVEGADPKKVVLVVTYPKEGEGFMSDTVVSYIPSD